MEERVPVETAEQGLVVMDIKASDEEALREVAEAVAGLWASSGTPTVRRVPGEPGVTGRLHLDVTRPGPGRVRRLPKEWVRFASPPWGGRVPTVKPTCIRARQDGRPCTRQAAEWPPGFVEDVDPGACWSHLTDAERIVCERARRLYRAAFWELKAGHLEEAGHGRDERCAGCALTLAMTTGVSF